MPSDADALAFGDIVLVPFPFTDQTAAKKRPAVVISAAVYNARHPDVILMPVTSQVRGDFQESVHKDGSFADCSVRGLLLLISRFNRFVC